MARRRTKSALTPEQKAQARKIKRQLRKEGAMVTQQPVAKKGDVADWSPQDEERLWSGIRAKKKAEQILNACPQRPYWLSIPKTDGIPPVSGFFPCTMFSRGDRWYYGFLFREHRDRLHKGWSVVHQARRELTGSGQVPLFV